MKGEEAKEGHKTEESHDSENIPLDSKEREQSRREVGYKILWIMGLLLRGEKLVEKEKIKDRRLLYQHVLSLFRWMLEEEGAHFMGALVQHDPHLFFQTMAHSFLEPGLVDYFREEDRGKEQDAVLSKICIKFEEIALLGMKDTPQTFYAYMVFLITIAGRTKFKVHKRDVQMACEKIFSSAEGYDREVEHNLLFVIKHYFYTHPDPFERLTVADIK